MVNGGDVDFGHKSHFRRDCWVIGAAHDRKHVDAVVEVCVGWPNDGSVPVGERLVVALVQPVGDGLIRKHALLALFQFVIKLECSWL